MPAADAALARAPSAHGPLRWLPLINLALLLIALSWLYQIQMRQRASEEAFAQRQNETLQQGVEARTLARQADASARDSATKVALLEGRVAESALQRGQIEDLMQSLSRSQDENLLADIESSLRVAQQQSALTGSVEPLALALKQAEERLARVQQPRLERVRRAVLKDLDRLRASGSVDVTALTLRLDEVIRQVADLPLVSAHGASGETPRVVRRAATARAAAAAASAPSAAGSAAQAQPIAAWWAGVQRLAGYVWAEVRELVRVTAIAEPEAALLAPEQAVYLRENLRLLLLNVRLSLLSRQFDSAQAGLREAQALMQRYFDLESGRVRTAVDTLRLLADQSRNVIVPRPEATLAALVTANAGP
jgi:uroporphyrin-3 C-methyltransferase